MALILDFGKYKNMSLEEIALGRRPLGEENPKSEGYFYFFQLIGGKEKYFQKFRTPENIERWTEIHKRLNHFKPIKNCGNCNDVASVVSIAGDNAGYSMHPDYVSCDRVECKEEIIRGYRSKLHVKKPGRKGGIINFNDKKKDDPEKYRLSQHFSGAAENPEINFNLDKYFYPIGFDTILLFGWNNGRTKHDEYQAYKLMMYLAGWPKGEVLNRKTATEFINALELRPNAKREKKANRKTKLEKIRNP
jgi:hypothetical protein